MLLKTTLGVILLRTAWQYYDNTKIVEEQEVNVFEEGLNTEKTAASTLRKRRSLSIDSNILDVFDYRTRSEKSSKKPKSKKPLSDIERFTLCSNRII